MKMHDPALLSQKNLWPQLMATLSAQASHMEMKRPNHLSQGQSSQLD